MAGRFNYNSANVPTGKAIGDVVGGDVMLGYRKIFGSTMVTGYVGADVSNYHTNDPFAGRQGTEWGVKFLVETYSQFTPNFDFFGMAFYSTTFDQWFALARPGFQIVPNFWIGPEGQVFGIGHNVTPCNPSGLGACDYAEVKAGGFIRVSVLNVPLLNDVIVSGGYRKAIQGDDSSGYYAQAGMVFKFQ